MHPTKERSDAQIARHIEFLVDDLYHCERIGADKRELRAEIMECLFVLGDRARKRERVQQEEATGDASTNGQKELFYENV
jgi:hypothetical protein